MTFSKEEKKMPKRYTSLMSFLKEEEETVKEVNASAEYIEYLERAFVSAPIEDKPTLNIMIGKEKQKYGENVSLLECCRGEISELINNLT